jgi:hypothetical protein
MSDETASDVNSGQAKAESPDERAGSWLRQLIRSVIADEAKYQQAQQQAQQQQTPTMAQVYEIADLIYRMRHTYEQNKGISLDAKDFSVFILDSTRNGGRKFETVTEAFETYAGFPVEGLEPVVAVADPATQASTEQTSAEPEQTS